jgi:hypothetical protein
MKRNNPNIKSGEMCTGIDVPIDAHAFPDVAPNLGDQRWKQCHT